MMNNQKYHIPVLLEESLDGLNIDPNGVYVDVTFGGGGHSRAIFDKLSNDGKLVAFDQDPEAAENAWQAPNFIFVAGNFSHLRNHLKLKGISEVDGILADLGVSSHQFDEVKRGFSFRGDAELDMRMNQHMDLTAKTIINEYPEEELIRIFSTYGEITNTKKLVNTIVAERSSNKIKTTQELIDVIAICAPPRKENKYFAQVFQALRIVVNDELKVLEDLLKQCSELIKPGGRLVVISYHSLEDRLVKNFMKRGSITGEINKDFFGNILKPFTEIVRKPIIANEEEINQNNRARSAKLRIAERNGE
jgi:16S rRNA (cytosine1402-N4)-methyltransferase